MPPSLMKNDLNADRRAYRSLRKYLVLIALLCLVMGAVACGYNLLHYSARQPFFDSMSYYSEMHRVMTITQSQGLTDGLERACFSNNTVCAPYIICALLALCMEPTRLIGVWIQTGELILCAGSLLIYLRRCRQVPERVAFWLVVPWLGMAALSNENGGLSDFRMDLSLTLMFTTCCLWYMIGHHSGKVGDFIILGCAIGVALLFRAIAPVYLLAGLSPIVFFDLYRAKSRKRLLGLLVLSSAIAFAIAGWFYLANFDFLYYYYFVWNQDANAKLPLLQALIHLQFLAEHMGVAVLGWWAASWLLLRNWDRTPRAMRGPKEAAVHADWRPLAIGLLILIMLIGRGMGENRFVSMPTAGLLLIAALLPLGEFWRQRESVSAALVAPSLVALLLSLGHGLYEHLSWGDPSMEAHQSVISAMVEDAKTQQCDRANYGTLLMMDMNATSLRNVLLYDTPDAQSAVEYSRVDGVTFCHSRCFSLATDVEWIGRPGATDALKIQGLVEQARNTIDYLVLPDEPSSQHARKHLAHATIHQHGPAIRQALLSSGDWSAITPALQNGDFERLRVYRNQFRRNQRLAQLNSGRPGNAVR